MSVALIKKCSCLGKYVGFITRETALLHKQVIVPHLEYCDFLVHSALKKNIKNFEATRKGVLKQFYIPVIKTKIYRTYFTQ